MMRAKMSATGEPVGEELSSLTRRSSRAAISCASCSAAAPELSGVLAPIIILATTSEGEQRSRGVALAVEGQ